MTRKSSFLDLKPITRETVFLYLQEPVKLVFYIYVLTCDTVTNHDKESFK